MRLFFYNKIGSIIPTVVLPTTEIIEPFYPKGFFDVQSDEDSSFIVFKVPESKSIAFDEFDEIIVVFQVF